MKTHVNYMSLCRCLCGDADGGPSTRNLQPQDLKYRTPQMIVATPGRLHGLMQMSQICLGQVSYLILDEAGRMLDPIVCTIALSLSRECQMHFCSTFYSAKLRDMVLSLCARPITSIFQAVPGGDFSRDIQVRLWIVRNTVHIVTYETDATATALVLNLTAFFSQIPHNLNRVVHHGGKRNRECLVLRLCISIQEPAFGFL